MRHMIISFALLLSTFVVAQDNAWSRILQEKVPSDLPMSSKLYQVARAHEVLGADFATQKADDFGLEKDRSGRLYLEMALHNKDQMIGADQRSIHGFPVHHYWRHMAAGYVSIADLLAVAKGLYGHAELYGVTIPSPNFEGLALQNADEYVAAGSDGSGVKVAVIDYGFGGLLGAVTAGALPNSIDTIATNSSPVTGGSVHGTACLEAVFDNAPGAELYAARVSGPVTFGKAIDSLIARGVDIISISLGPHNEGWDDDSGPFCAAVTTACNAGILVFISAGNEANRHWQGNFQDDGNGDHAWDGISDTSNDIVVDQGERIRVWLQWDSDPPSDPYNLELLNPLGQLAASSSSSSQFESLDLTSTFVDSSVYSIVVKANGAFRPEFEIFIDRINLEFAVAASSIESPGNTTHPNAITVGAVDQSVYTSAPGSNVIAGYSSLGPTNSGNMAPDIAAVTGITTFSYTTPFTGTSSSTPNAAGAAAVLMSEHPNYSASGIRQLLLRKAELFKDWGVAGNDNTYGHGGLQLKDRTSNTLYILSTSGNTTGTSLLPYSSIHQANAFAPDGWNLYFLGGTYNQPPANTIINDPMLFRSVTEDALTR